MKKKDIIQLVKETIKEVDQFGNRQGPSNFQTSAVAPTDEYPFSKRPKRTASGYMEEELMSSGLETRQLADSFTFDELEQLYKDNKITKADLNGAKNYLQAWIDQHPTYLPQRDLTTSKRQEIRDIIINATKMKNDKLNEDVNEWFGKDDSTRSEAGVKKLKLKQFCADNPYDPKCPGMKEDITDDISSAEDEVATATQAKADAESKVADARKKKADAEKGALEEQGGHENSTIQYYIDQFARDVEEGGRKGGTEYLNAIISAIANLRDTFEYYDDKAGMMESYIKERGDDNLMEHMDKYRKRNILMEGATEKLFAMFNDGKTNDDVIHHYSLQRIIMPDSFVSKLRKTWEDMRKTKLELTLADKEAEGFNQTAAQSSQEMGMERGMEEKKLASGLFKENKNNKK